MDKMKLMYGTFKYATLSQLKQEDTFAIGVAVGLYQGLKYNGSLIRGIKAGAATVGAISVASGVMNVIQQMEKIKSI